MNEQAIGARQSILNVGRLSALLLGGAMTAACTSTNSGDLSGTGGTGNSIACPGD